jgi:hypothetical protein
MTSTNLTTTNFKVKAAKEFISSEDNSLYLAVGKNEIFAGSAIPTPVDDYFETNIDPYRTMLFGKKVRSSDMSLMIPRYDYQYGTTYAKYNDADPLLFQKQFYTIVNAVSYYHVFKCLDNAFDTPSVIQPNFADIGSYDDLYKTSDGYVWKYMFTVDSTTVQKYATLDWFPYVANNTVIENAIDGSIDVVEITSFGSGYRNYSNGTFSSSDVQLDGNNVLYRISNTASTTTDFYKGCIVYITSDSLGNSAGQYKKITGYTVNATTKFIQIDSPFTNIPVNGATYQIYPEVNIIGNGFETTNAVAWAIINSTANTLDYVQILNRGQGYRYSTAVVNAHSSVNVTSNAEVRPIYTPYGGHGSHPEFELGATSVCLSANLANTESNTIFANTNYQRMIVINNPLFNDVYVYLSNQEGTFLPSENVVVWKNEVEINIESGIFQAVLYTNNDIQIANTGVFPNTLGSLVLSNTTTGVINNISSNGNYIVLDKIQCCINVGDIVIGQTSNAYGYISQITRSGEDKGFNTFIQARRYDGYISSGIFSNAEIVYQTSTNSYGILASVNASTLFVVDQFNDIATSDSIIGNTSGAEFIVTNKYKPELDFSSGEILHVSNFDMVSRSQTRTETFKVIISPTEN